jgi:hypothetical protein
MPSPNRTFLSYSHDSPEHRQWVLELANRLRTDGVDCWIDRFDPAPPDGWPRWMERQLKQANFVVLVCTETYRRRFEGQEEPGRGLGAPVLGTCAGNAGPRTVGVRFATGTGRDLSGPWPYITVL